MQDHDHEGSVCLSSLVIGALAGAGLALLLAPRSGSETRRMVSDKVRESADRGRDVASRAKEKGRQLAEAAAEKGRETVGSAAPVGGGSEEQRWTSSSR